MFPADPSETDAILRSPIEQEAHRKCRLRDHAWMSDSRFEWQGYSVSQRKDTPGKPQMTREIRSCRFCGHFQLLLPLICSLRLSYFEKNIREGARDTVVALNDVDYILNRITGFDDVLTFVFHFTEPTYIVPITPYGWLLWTYVTANVTLSQAHDLCRVILMLARSCV